MFFPITDDGSAKNIRILVVEDVDFNLKILTGILAERGWQVVPAVSGEAALDILDQDTDFQIILMDIGLPGIDGLEAMRRIKANPATSAIPVIALTAETVAERERFLAAGLDGYAEKNFDPEQLFAVIERHLFPDCGNHHGTNSILVNPATLLDLDFEALLASYPNEESLCRIASAFFADTDKELLLLGEAMESGKQTEIIACCHSIRGAAAIFTASNLGLAAKEMEDSISSGKKNESHSAWQKVRAAHASLRQIVSKRLNLEQQNK
jgi:CheY-like chemotaxis protein/HPt (histidine-containing phosphotransfer) domain-containing protein